MTKKIQLAKLGTKGQLVIPNELREALKLEPGDAVTVQLEGARLILERRKTVILAMVGKYAVSIVKLSKSIDISVLEGGEHNGA